MTIIEQKQALRRLIRARVSAMPSGELARISEQINGRLSALPELPPADTVFCFVGTAREIDTRPFLEAVLRMGKRLCVPCCVGPGVMELRAVSALSELAPGAYGILEPPRESPLVRADDVDFAVVPCLSCDRAGRRLGKGGGYYDRFLMQYRGFAVMVCPESLMTERVPMEAHDRAVPCVLTERGCYRDGTPVKAPC